MSDIVKALAKYGQDDNRGVDVSNLQVEDSGSVLDRMPTGQRIEDKKQKQVLPGQRIIIIDDAKIRSVMATPREERRKFLAKLTDAQRRRFLDRYQQIKDEEAPSEEFDNGLKKVQLININNLLTNLAFDPSQYNQNALIQYCDVLGPEADFWKDLGAKLVDGTLSQEELDSAIDHFEEMEVETSLAQVVNAVGVEEVDEDNNNLEEVDATEDDISLYEDEVQDAVRAATNTSFEGMYALADALVAKYTARGCNITDTEKVVVAAISKRIEELKIRDDVVNKLAELPLIDVDGNKIEEESTDKKSGLEVLDEALQSFIGGDDGPLKALAEMTVEGDAINAENGEGNANEESTEEEDNEEATELNFDDEESIEDAVKRCARYVLGADKKSAKIIDALRSKVPTLSKYAFKKSSMTKVRDFVVEGVESVPEPVLSREDFYTTYKEPAYVKTMAMGCESCIPVNEVVPNCECGFVTTNPKTIPQNWVPIKGSVDDFMSQIEGMSPNDIANVIDSNCVLVDNVNRVAAETNNLAIIDNRFYKKHLSDTCWSCDEVPDCLQGAVQGPCDVYPSWSEIPADVPTISILICGTDYSVLPK